MQYIRGEFKMNEEYGFMGRVDATEWIRAHMEDDRFMLVETISRERCRISGSMLRAIIIGSAALVLVAQDDNPNSWVVRLIPRGPLHQLVGYRCDIPFFILAKKAEYAVWLNRLCDKVMNFSERWLTRGGIKEEEAVVELLTHPEIYYKKIEVAFASANAEIDRLVGTYTCA
jgi:hypothetical protein